MLERCNAAPMGIGFTHIPDAGLEGLMRLKALPPSVWQVTGLLGARGFPHRVTRDAVKYGGMNCQAVRAHPASPPVPHEFFPDPDPPRRLAQRRVSRLLRAIGP